MSMSSIVVIARNRDYGRVIAAHHGLAHPRGYTLVTPRNQGESLRGLTPTRVIADPHWRVGARPLFVRLIEESLAVCLLTRREPLKVETTDAPSAQIPPTLAGGAPADQ